MIRKLKWFLPILFIAATVGLTTMGCDDDDDDTDMARDSKGN